MLLQEPKEMTSVFYANSVLYDYFNNITLIRIMHIHKMNDEEQKSCPYIGMN